MTSACNFQSSKHNGPSPFWARLFQIVFFLVLSTVMLPGADAKQAADIMELDRCDPVRLNAPRTCEDGTVLWAWEPKNSSHLTTTEVSGRAIVYLIAMLYLFLGVSIIADRFMASIEVITSKEKEIVYKNRNGEKVTTTVRIWNETVSNLTLMALGSSAPEIMLSVIEICFKGFYAGELGPSTIVGSASFNLFIIIALCMYVIPDDEIRKVKHPRVFAVTAVWSVMAYFWLYFILATSSPGVVTITEGVITLLFFPFLVLMAWVADRRLLVYKFMYKRYRAKRGNIVVETEGRPEDEEDEGKEGGFTSLPMEALENGSVGISSQADGLMSKELTDDPDENRRIMVRIMRDLRKRFPEADMAEIAKMASAEALSKQQKSRAFYRIQATRLMTGAGNILNKNKQDVTVDQLNDEPIIEEDEEQAKISFEPAEYKVMENCGYCEAQVVRKGGDLNRTIYVDYRTVDGTANAGSDYVKTESTLIFRPGETHRFVQIEIMDDDIFEEDEFFRVELFNVRSHAPDGMYDENGETEPEPAKLVPPTVATVVILDDDHAGVFSFPEPTLTITEGVGVLKCEVQRNSGARGKIAVPYKTVNGTAKGGGVDYIDAVGELEFDNDETSKFVSVTIIDDEEYEKNKNFFIQLLTPRLISDDGGDSVTDGSDSGINGKDEEEPTDTSKILTEEEEEAKRISELGKPRLGENQTLEIMIEESYEFKNTVDKLIKKANLAVIVGTSSWREQFVEAFSVNGGGDDDDDEETGEPSFIDYVMHFLTVFWKILFAFVPPTEYAGGWACFTVSIIGIGLLTAVIGDVASHFGCTINLNDEVTAVTLVAMGTSVPDTFASKVAAISDQYADASIGNVTGSNAVNVFLGIGLAWTIAAVYWAIMGKTPEEKLFRVEPGNLAFSVTVFSVFAFIAISILILRRRMPSVAAELGGPKKEKTISSCVFIFLWFAYILLSSLQSYCIIPSF